GLNLDRLERDNTELRERLAYFMHDKLGIPNSYQRFIKFFINENQKGNSGVFADIQQPNQDYVNCWFPGESDGELYKIDDWFEFNDATQVSREFNENAQMLIYNTTGGVKKKARYRWSWFLEPDCSKPESYTNLFELADAFNLTPNTEEYENTITSLVDEELVRAIALRHMSADWDGWGYNRGKNSSIYKVKNGKWFLIPWDLDFAFGSGGTSPTAGLLSVNDPIIRNNYLQHASVRRAYWRAIYESANGPLQAECYSPLIDQLDEAFQNNGFPGLENPTSLKNWMGTRGSYLQGQLGSVAATFAITSNGGANFSTASQIETLAGTAPVNVAEIRVNGVPYALDFSSITAWNLQVALTNGPNVLLVEGYDEHGQFVADDTITITFTGMLVPPTGFLTINEIMYNPVAPAAEFVEIYNNSSTLTFGLGGLRINGIGFTFEAGSIIMPNQYVVVVESTAAFISEYGAMPVILGEYGGALDNGGETLSLVYSNMVIDSVRYDDMLPWPLAADNGGSSLQLIDPDRDNSVIGNWGVDTGPIFHTPGAPNSISQVLPPFPTVRINELQPNNLNTLQDNFGDFDPWVELFNFGPGSVSLDNLFLTDDLLTPTTWNFPGGNNVDTNEYLIVWADAETGENAGTDYHSSFALSPTGGVVGLYWQNGPDVFALDAVYYDPIGPNQAYGLDESMTNGDPRILFF
ncbi:MAG: CotH kinase family protein, partial [Verrucomicrobiota bacterium]